MKRSLPVTSPSRAGDRDPTQMKLEGFFKYTPLGEDVRSVYVEVYVPDPDSRAVRSPADVRRVTRWLVSCLDDGEVLARGVCATGGFESLMEEACREHGPSRGPDAAFLCAYGIVDLQGRPFYPRSRREIAGAVDRDAAWPSHVGCSCAGCRRLFGGADRLEGDVVLNKESHDRG